jgi:hypothetical protein
MADLILEHQETFPFHLGKPPHQGPDAAAVHHEANQPQSRGFVTRETTKAYWQQMREMGVVDIHDWHLTHTIAAVPDHLMLLGVPEFEFPRNHLRPNVHYFGALKTKKKPSTSSDKLPEWWDDVAAAKAAGKHLVAVSQGTVGTNLNDLLIPTLEALKDRDDVLVIATTVAVEPADVPNLVVPSNARVAKFVPYDLLLPQVSCSIPKLLTYAQYRLTLHRSTSSSTTAVTARSYKASQSASRWSSQAKDRIKLLRTRFWS